MRDLACLVNDEGAPLDPTRISCLVLFLQHAVLRTNRTFGIGKE